LRQRHGPPSCDSQGPEDTRLGGGESLAIVANHAGGALARRFGQPSSYSLTHAELTAEVRRRRRDGWQGWEIRARFDFGTSTRAA
jgi:hypothetical protein